MARGGWCYAHRGRGTYYVLGPVEWSAPHDLWLARGVFGSVGRAGCDDYGAGWYEYGEGWCKSWWLSSAGAWRLVDFVGDIGLRYHVYGARFVWYFVRYLGREDFVVGVSIPAVIFWLILASAWFLRSSGLAIRYVERYWCYVFLNASFFGRY